MALALGNVYVSPIKGTFSSDTILTSTNNHYAGFTQNIDLKSTPIPANYSLSLSRVSISPPTNTAETTATPNPTPLSTTIPAPQPTKSSDPTLQTLTEFDIIGIAKIVLLILAIIWLIVIVFYVDQQFTSKKQ